MPDALAAFGKLGIAFPEEDSFPFRGIRFAGEGVAVDAAFPRGRGLGVRRPTLHALLVEHAQRAGVTLLWGTAISGVENGVVRAGAAAFHTRWVIGADGVQSRVRRWAGLDRSTRFSQRFAFRCHYRVAPWTANMEIWWGPACQLYITPVTADTVCVALISRQALLRPELALPLFPEVVRKLEGARTIGRERGAVSVTRRLRAVCTGSTALVGDASGSVDAITGEGLCLAVKQALALADALEAGDLRGYQAEHRRMARRPAFMADFMLLLDRYPRLRRRALRALAANPQLFARMVATHVGEIDPLRFAGTTAALGWRILTR